MCLHLTHCGLVMPYDQMGVSPSYDLNGLVQDCSNSIANALELFQSCTKPSIWTRSSMTKIGQYFVDRREFIDLILSKLNCILIFTKNTQISWNKWEQ